MGRDFEVQDCNAWPDMELNREQLTSPETWKAIRMEEAYNSRFRAERRSYRFPD